MCAVHSQPVKGRAAVLLARPALLALCDVAFTVSSSVLCLVSVVLAFLPFQTARSHTGSIKQPSTGMNTTAAGDASPGGRSRKGE